MTMAAPAGANAIAIARPMPELEPVTSATWPRSRGGSDGSTGDAGAGSFSGEGMDFLGQRACERRRTIARKRDSKARWPTTALVRERAHPFPEFSRRDPGP